MADLKAVTKVKVDAHIQLSLDIEEAKALRAITGYGPKIFVEWFYKTHGKAYMEKHEHALLSLFDTVNKELPRQISRIDDLHQVIREQLNK